MALTGEHNMVAAVNNRATETAKNEVDPAVEVTLPLPSTAIAKAQECSC